MDNAACQSCFSTEDIFNIVDTNFTHDGNVVQFSDCYKFCTSQTVVGGQAKICQICFKQYKNLYIFQNKVQHKPEIDDSSIKTELEERVTVVKKEPKKPKDAAKTIVNITGKRRARVKNSKSIDLQRDFLSSSDHTNRFDCLFCPMYTANSSSLGRHLSSRHKDTDPSIPTLFAQCLQLIDNNPDTGVSIHKCKVCGCQFAEYYEFKLHVFSVHQISKRLIHCEICYKSFTGVDCMLRHREKYHIEFKEYTEKDNAKKSIMGLSVYRKPIRYYNVQTIQNISAKEFGLNMSKGCVYCGRRFESMAKIKRHLVRDCNTNESAAQISCMEKLMTFENYNNRDLSCVRCSSTTNKLFPMRRRKYTFEGSQISMISVYKFCTGIDADNEFTRICDVCDVQLKSEYDRMHAPDADGQLTYLHQPSNAVKAVKPMVNSRTLDVSKIIDQSSIVAVPSYRCKSCDGQFQEYDAFKKHLLHHHQEEICLYACVVCSQIFYYSSDLTHHEAAKHAKQVSMQPPRYTCEYCPEHFIDEKKLLDHLWDTHNGIGTIQFKCELCPEFYPLQCALTKHMRRTHQEFQTLCTICGKYFPKDNHREHFKRAHREKKLVKCDLCPLSFISKAGIKNHIKRIHEKKLTTTCKRCELVFKNTGDRMRHMEDVHLMKKKTCDFCPKKYATFKSVWEHSFDHRGFLPFVCSNIECAFKTKIKSALQQHLKKHHSIAYDELIHGYRESEFERIKQLQESKTSSVVMYENRTKPATQQCKLCPKKFSRAHNLKRHIKDKHDSVTHELECAKCGAKFNRQLSLWCHAFHHMDYKPYNCTAENCNMKTAFKARFVQHLLKQHTIKYDNEIHGFNKKSFKDIINMVLKS